MLFESIPPIVLAAVISSIVSGIILTINNYWVNSVNNKFQLEREKEQGIRQQESDQQKWYREKIYDSYKKSIQILVKVLQTRFEIKATSTFNQTLDIKVTNLLIEFTAEVSIIVIGHPDKESKEFQTKIGKIDEFLVTNAMGARAIIIELMENDPRIKNINK